MGANPRSRPLEFATQPVAFGSGLGGSGPGEPWGEPRGPVGGFADLNSADMHSYRDSHSYRDPETHVAHTANVVEATSHRDQNSLSSSLWVQYRERSSGGYRAKLARNDFGLFNGHLRFTRLCVQHLADFHSFADAVVFL